MTLQCEKYNSINFIGAIPIYNIYDNNNIHRLLIWFNLTIAINEVMNSHNRILPGTEKRIVC